MKRVKFLSLLSILFLALLLVACGDNNETSGNEEPAETTTPAATEAEVAATEADDDDEAPAASGDIVTLNWYMPGASDAEDSEVVWEAMNEYLAQYGLAVNIVSLGWGELADMAELRLSAGDSMDIFYTWHARFPDLARRGLLLDMSPWLESSGQAVLNYFGSDFVNRMRFTDGGIYMMPASGTALTPTQHWVFNADQVDAHGIDLPSRLTTTEMVALLETVADEFDFLQVTQPGHMSQTPIPFHYIAGNVFGFDVYGDATVVRNVFELDVTRAHFNAVRAGADAGLFHILEEGASQAFVSELADDEWLSLNQVYSGSDRSRQALEGTVGGRRIYTVEIYQPFATGINFEGNVIGAQTDHPEEAMKFLYLLQTSEELNNFIAWGIEGVHWVRNDLGHAERTERGQDYFNRSPWQFGLNQFVRTAPADFPDIEAEYAAINADFHIPASMGFVFDPTGFETELAAVANILDEFRQPLTLGLVADVDGHIDTILTRIELAGGNDIMEEMQRQFDEWYANMN